MGNVIMILFVNAIWLVEPLLPNVFNIGSFIKQVKQAYIFIVSRLFPFVSFNYKLRSEIPHGRVEV